MEQADDIDNPVDRVKQYDDIDNAKSPLIGDLDGINNEYYQVKGNNMDDNDYKSIQHLDPEDDIELIPTDDGYWKDKIKADDEHWEEDSNNPILVNDNPTNKSVSTLLHQRQFLTFPPTKLF